MFSVQMARRRSDRLSSSPAKYDINTSQKLNDYTVMESIRPLLSSKVTRPMITYLGEMMMWAVNEGPMYESRMTNTIVNDIIPGVEDLSLFKESLQSVLHKFSVENVDYINEAINDNIIYDRVIRNDFIISKRFNFNKIIRETYDMSDCIYELCSMIDTYQTTPYAKYNIALENILYSISKSGKDVSKKEILENVTGYFLMQDREISDKEYKKLGHVLESNRFYTDARDSSLAKALLEGASDGNGVYSKKINILADRTSSDYARDAITAINDIKNEEDAHKAIAHIGDVATYTDVGDNDRGLLYGAIKLIPLVAGITTDFVDIEVSKYVDIAGSKYDLITPVVIADDDFDLTKPAPLDIKGISTDVLENMILYEASDTDDMDKLMAKYKAQQKKDVPGLKRLVTRFYSKKPEQVIKELPDIFSLIRIGFVAAPALFPVIGPVISIFAGLITWFIQKRISEKEAIKLLEYLKSEKKKVEKKIDSAGTDKTKKRYEDYLKEIDDSIEKVTAYADSISGEDHNTDSSSDDMGFDFDDDMTFESAVSKLNDILIIAESLASTNMANLPEKDIALKGIAENADLDNFYISRVDEESVVSGEDIKDIAYSLANMDNSLFSDFATVLSKSSFANTADEAFKEMYESSYFTDYKLSTLLSSAKRLITENANDEMDLVSLTESYYCNEAVKKISKLKKANKIKLFKSDKPDKKDKPKEHFNLNSVKLILQDAKRKVQNVSTKIKSASQSANAYASGVVNGIEKSMTSDRREAVIKGRILPSFTQMMKYAITIAAAGVVFQPLGAVITAVGLFAVNKSLTYREKKMVLDEIETELKVVEKQIQIAENDNNMKQYRILLNTQKKLIRERQRIKYNMKAVGKNVPIPSVGTNNDD